MADSALTVELSADIKNFTASMQQATQQLGRIAAQSKTTQSSINGMASSMKVAAVSIGAFVSGQILQGISNLQQSFIKMVEGPQNLQASFKALLGDGDRAANMLQRVYQTAKTTGVAFQQTAEITQKMTVGLKDMGASNAQIQTMTETLLKLGTIGGSSIEDTAGAALQLAQALGSGKLQGDELRSIMERMPLLGQAIAKEMGVSVGQLKSLGAEGKITSDIIANSLLKSATNVNELFKAMPLTVGRALNNIKTAFTEGFDTSAARAAVASLAQAINGASDFAERFARGLVDLAAGVSELWRTSEGFRNSFALILPMLGLFVAGLAPIPTALAAAAAGVAYVIANFGSLRQSLNDALSALLSFAQGWIDGWNKLTQATLEKINGLVGGINKLATSFTNTYSAIFGNGSIPQATQLIEPFEKTALAMTETAEAASKLQQGFAANRQAYRDNIDDLERIQGATARTSSEMNKLAGATTEAAKKGGGDSLKTWANNLINSADAARKYAQDMERLSEALKKGYISQEEFALGAERLKKQMTDAQSKTSGLATEMSQFASNAGNAFFDAIANGKSFGKVLQSLALDLAKLLFQMLVIKPLLGSLFGGGGGGLGSLFGGGTKSLHPSTRAFAIGGGGPAGVTRAAGSFASQISARGLLADGGGVNVGNISISVAEGSGTSTGDTETGKALGDRIKQAVLMTLVQERRPGGILAGTR